MCHFGDKLIKKIWEVDPLSCPRCGHEMKLISLINEPDVIERDHAAILRNKQFLKATKRNILICLKQYI